MNPFDGTRDTALRPRSLSASRNRHGIGFLRFLGTVAAAACALVLFPGTAGNAADDPEQVLENLAIDYVASGGDNDQLKSQLESQLESQAKAAVIGIADLAGAEIGIPGAGEIVSSLIGAFSGSGGGSQDSAVISAIDKRLDGLEHEMAKVSLGVDRLNIRSAQQANQFRLDAVVGNLPSGSGGMFKTKQQAADLSTRKLQGADAKLDFLNDILIVADGYKPVGLDGSTDIWKWDNIVINSNPGGGPRTSISQVDSLDLALAPYLEALALFVRARSELGVSLTPDMQQRVRAHVAFLTGIGKDVTANGLRFSILESRIYCGWNQDSGPGGNAYHPHFWCHSGDIERTDERDWSTWTVPDSIVSQEEDSLEEEVREQLMAGASNDPVVNAVVAAARALLPAASPSSSQNGFDMSVEILGGDALYARDAAGHLHLFTHQITRTDTWAASQRSSPNASSPLLSAALHNAVLTPLKPKDSDRRGGVVVPPPDCSTPAGRLSNDCHPRVVLPDDVRHASIDNRISAKAGDQSLLTRFRIDHPFYEQNLIINGDWSAFSAILPSQPFPDGLVVYGLTGNGMLIWRRIGSSNKTLNPVPVFEARSPAGSGWSRMKNVFSTGEGIIYGVDPDGNLIWYHHLNNLNGFADTGAEAARWEQHAVGSGWGGFVRLFSPGKGVIYAVKPDGTLLWYKHAGYLTGARIGEPNPWLGPRQVRTGWNGFTSVFAGTEGDIYAVNSNGELIFYKHDGWEFGGANWEAPVKLSDGWDKYGIAFAEMGGTGDHGGAPVVVK